MSNKRERSLNWLRETFTGWRFPAFALTLIVVYELGVFAMLMLPVGEDPVGRFAEEFKMWCFGYDPATGRSQPMYLILMISEPLVLGLMLLGVYWNRLKEMVSVPRRLIPYALLALLFASGSIVALTKLAAANAPRGELPFPAERIRTAHIPPNFRLIDQDEEEFELAQLDDKIVIITGVYASCVQTCPMILAQARDTFLSLSEEEQAEVVFAAITLQPTVDTPEVLSELAYSQDVSAPSFRLLTGEPAKVEALLDRLGFERRKDPETGEIDHSNLFMVLDAQGKVAYRFTLGERQQRWLVTAIKQLIEEKNRDPIPPTSAMHLPLGATHKGP